MRAVDGIIVTDTMRQAGEDIAEHFIVASARKALGASRIGGCTPFDINEFPAKYRKLIELYVNDELSSVEAIYIAMRQEEHNAAA